MLNECPCGMNSAVRLMVPDHLLLDKGYNVLQGRITIFIPCHGPASPLATFLHSKQPALRFTSYR